jgi:tetratricopeptide (TPR) repeat protein
MFVMPSRSHKMPFSLLSTILLVWGIGGSGQGVASQPSPAQQKIEAARKAIGNSPQKYQGYNDLAQALMRRVRETSDAAYYKQAEEALQQSFRLAPDNFEGQKLQVLLLLGEQEYRAAREKARGLNRRMPDDVLVWGYIADADMALGDYADAERCAQWMLDLRPGNTPGLIRGARLRTLYGDFEGARDFLKQAYLQTPPNEVEDLAWYLSQTADLQLASGKLDDAEQALKQALELFPGYYLALEGMARVRTLRHEFQEAVDLLQLRNQQPAQPQEIEAMAAALERAGRRPEAQSLYRRFEEQARLRMEKADNANRSLVFYYADHAHKPEEALRIARLEIARRHDVDTLDAYAWALYANRNYTEARSQLGKALAVGVRDAALFYRAGAIAAALNDRTAASRYFKESLDLNSFSEFAPAAREGLVLVRRGSNGLAPASAHLNGR